VPNSIIESLGTVAPGTSAAAARRPRITEALPPDTASPSAALSKVLVADDQPAIRRILRASLEAQGYLVAESDTGLATLEHLRGEAADVLVLDLWLPDIDGLEIIERLRAEGSTLPIVVLSSRADEVGKVRALDLGADDYITKPFGIDELLARIRAALRHRLQQQHEPPLFRCGALVVDLGRRIVKLGSAELKLTPREYDLLRLLVAHAGKVLTHRYILREVWGAGGQIQYLRIYIRALRQKIEVNPDQPCCILTEQGVGYWMRAPD
jgi:two-component system, OmpR family, KDP operon response regulator KdpE